VAVSEDVINLDRKPQHGETFEVTVDRLDRDGRGAATLRLCIGPQRDLRDYSVRLRGALPGDRVLARVKRVRRREIEAQVAERRESSMSRVEPRCPHFLPEAARPGCGGCIWQDLAYEQQLVVKRDVVRRALAQAKIDPDAVAEVIGVADPFFYRNKMEFSFAAEKDGSVGLGLHPPGFRYEVIELKSCDLISPVAGHLLIAARDWANAAGLSAYRHRQNSGLLRTLTLREGKRTGERLLELTTAALEQGKAATGPPAWIEGFRDRALDVAREAGFPLSSIFWTEQITARGQRTRFFEHHLHGEQQLTEELHLPGETKLRFEIHPRAFFQPNTLQAEVLYARVLEAAGQQRETLRALDLYCGTGTIALCLAPYVKEVLGVELSPEAVKNAEDNAKKNGLTNARFYAGDVGKVLRGELAGELVDIDLIVVDPPRSGLLPDAINEIERVGAAKLVYVSCNPQALGRDLALLGARGYRVESVQPVDMFPQTPHVETVVGLVRTT